jgi:hypothetical protein
MQRIARVSGRWLLAAPVVLAAVVGGSSLQASFTYANEDLIAGFRQSGGVSELVVNLGPVSGFEGLAAGQVSPIDRKVVPDPTVTMWGAEFSLSATIGDRVDLPTMWLDHSAQVGRAACPQAAAGAVRTPHPTHDAA